MGLTNGSELTDPPGDAGTASGSPTDTITWDILADEWQRYTAGGYFWVNFTNGDATSVELTWYTSQQASGTNDWALHAPVDSLTLTPTSYDVLMPAGDMDFIVPIPLPAGVRRVKCVWTATGGTPTDIVAIRLIKADR